MAKAAKSSTFTTLSDEGCIKVLSASPGNIGYIMDIDKLDLVVLNLKAVSSSGMKCNVFQTILYM